MVAVRHIYFQALVPILILSPYSRGGEYDAQDIIWVLATYWKSVDINRIPEEDMENFVAANPSAQQAWNAIKQRFNA